MPAAPNITFVEAQDLRGVKISTNDLTFAVDWSTGAVLPPTEKAEWSPVVTPDEARAKLKDIAAKVGTKGRLLARWHSVGANVKVAVVLFRKAMPKFAFENTPEWFTPRPDIYDRLMSKKDII